MSAASEAIRPDELGALFTHLCDGPAAGAVALAVSGGSDSTALMVLFADWLRRCGAEPAPHIVLTVDHRLRSASAAEAAAVAGLAAQLGFRHATLAWEGPKPQTGLQAAARQARYRLMGDYARALGLGTLLTAHTLDDQAETLLMRLARGSGLDGLTAIAPVAPLAALLDGLRLVRPLIGVPKSRLRATLERRGIPWIEDPSNQSPAFERTRLREARATLDALGLTPQMLGLSVRRLQRARAALDSATQGLCAEPPEGIVRTDPCGAFMIDRERLNRTPEEIMLRLIERCIAAAGGTGEPVPLSSLETIVSGLRAYGGRAPGNWTLSRALLAATADTVEIAREPGRQPLPCLELEGGGSALWDGRFAVAVGEGVAGSVEVRALGAEGLVELRRSRVTVQATRALQLSPSFWDGARLLAVPAIGFWANDELRGRLCAAFLGVRYNLGASAQVQSDDSDMVS